MKRTPYQKIVDAAREGRGTRLTAEETFMLASDHSIFTAAENDDAMDGLPDDERAHYFCFVSTGEGEPTEIGTCDGDGWYRCKECSKYRGQ